MKSTKRSPSFRLDMQSGPARREIDDGLKRRRSILRQVQVRAHALVGIPSVEEQRFLAPRTLVLDALDGLIERTLIVGVHAAHDLEHLVVDRFFLGEVARPLIDRCERGLGWRLDVLDAPESVGRRPVDGRLRVEVGEHVAGLVPATSRDETHGA